MLHCVHLLSRRARAALGAALLALTCGGARAQTITLEVDASDLHRHLLRSTMTIRAQAGPLALSACVWTPGNHTPSGPIENMVDVVVRDCRGQPLEWRRDPLLIERIHLVVPEGCDSVRVDMAYIASQPNANSRSTDSYGRADLGVLNWNTVLMYPVGPSNQEISVLASLAVPSAWAYATALPTRAQEGERFDALRSLTPGARVTWAGFQQVSLAELIDTPVIMGRHIQAHPLDPGVPGAPPHVLVVASADERNAEVPAWLLAKLSAACAQTIRAFAPPGGPVFPWPRYEFLVVLDDTMGFGVEHATSTLVALKAGAFRDAKQDELRGGGAAMSVLPHEYAHAWCGKLVAPEGLVGSDFHTPSHTDLLWVYEGLVSYYDMVLSARAGLTSVHEFHHELLTLAVSLEQQSGRLWRSVQDTALAARLLRQRSRAWADRRRNQDYYGEGSLFWLEADALIRAGSDGARSLDDFCRALFDVGPRRTGQPATFTRQSVIDGLRALEPRTDWDALVRARIEQPADDLSVARVLARLGWRVDFAPQPTPQQRTLKHFEDEKPAEATLRTSIGLRAIAEGEITEIVPESPADACGLGVGMKIVAVDGLLYTPARLRDAVRTSPERGKIELLVLNGDHVEPRTILYAGGPRIPRLVRIPGTTDVLEAIAKPLD